MEAARFGAEGFKDGAWILSTEGRLGLWEAPQWALKPRAWPQTPGTLHGTLKQGERWGLVALEPGPTLAATLREECPPSTPPLANPVLQHVEALCQPPASLRTHAESQLLPGASRRRRSSPSSSGGQRTGLRVAPGLQMPQAGNRRQARKWPRTPPPLTWPSGAGPAPPPPRQEQPRNRLRCLLRRRKPWLAAGDAIQHGLGLQASVESRNSARTASAVRRARAVPTPRHGRGGAVWGRSGPGRPIGGARAVVPPRPASRRSPGAWSGGRAVAAAAATPAGRWVCGPRVVGASRPSRCLPTCPGLASGPAARAFLEKRRTSGAQEPRTARVGVQARSRGRPGCPRGPAGTGSVCRGSVCPLEVCGSEGPRGRGRAPSKREADRTRPGGIAAPSLVRRSRGERPAGGRCSDTEVRPGASQLQWEMQLSPRPEDSRRHDHCLPFLCSDRMGNRTQQPLYWLTQKSLFAACRFTRLLEGPVGRGLGQWRATGEDGHQIERALCSHFSGAGAEISDGPWPVYRSFPALSIWAWWAFSVDCGVSSGNCSGLLDVLVTVELSEGSLFRVLGWLVVVGSQL